MLVVIEKLEDVSAQQALEDMLRDSQIFYADAKEFPGNKGLMVWTEGPDEDEKAEEILDLFGVHPALG